MVAKGKKIDGEITGLIMDLKMRQQESATHGNDPDGGLVRM